MASKNFADTRFRIDYTVAVSKQEVANNRSYIRRRLVMVKQGSSSAWSGGGSTWSSSGPTSTSGSFGFDFGAYSSLVLMDRYEWVAHNSDGSRSFTSAATVRADLPNGWDQITLSFAVNLPKIPRATDPIFEAGAFVTGTSFGIDLPRKVSSYTHDISYTIGSKSDDIELGAATESSWNAPQDLATEFPNSESSNVTIKTVTKSGATVIGTKNSVLPLLLDSTVVPTIPGDVTWTDQNTDIATNIGAFVQGLSRLKGSFTGEGVYGSTVDNDSRRIQIGAQEIDLNTELVPSGSGTINTTAKITDSRGRIGTKPSSFTVLPYQKPKLGSGGWSVKRGTESSPSGDGTGTHLWLQLHAIVNSLMVGPFEKNAMHIKVWYKASNGGWSSPQLIDPSSLTYNSTIDLNAPAGGFLESLSYEIRIEIWDEAFPAAGVEISATISTTIVAIDIYGNSVGIGKMRERGVLDVGGDTYVEGNLFITNSVSVSEDIDVDGDVNVTQNLTVDGQTNVSDFFINGIRNGGYIYSETIMFTANGTFDKTDYPDCRAIRVRVQGGGAGGGGAGTTSSGNNSYGTGGGGGAYAESFINLNTIEEPVSILIGAGGSGGAGAASGGSGGSSSFGGIVVAAGGFAGTFKPNSALGGYIGSGDGGLTTTGDIGIPGGPGAGGTGAAGLCSSGSGGNSVLGSGGGNVGSAASGGTSNGRDGRGYGGGGGGAMCNQSASAKYGGDGAPGIIIIELYR